MGARAGVLEIGVSIPQVGLMGTAANVAGIRTDVLGVGH
jgi:hypothetical protein